MLTKTLTKTKMTKIKFMIWNRIMNMKMPMTRRAPEGEGTSEETYMHNMD